MAVEKKLDCETESSPVRKEVEETQPKSLYSIRLKYVKLGYHYLISNAMYLLIIPLLAASAAVNFSVLNIQDIVQLCNHHLKYNVLAVISCTSLMAVLATIYFMSRPRKVYLVDFACYKPDPKFECTTKLVIEKVSTFFSEESVTFMKKVLQRSGLGEKTFAGSLLDFPPRFPVESARKEAEMVMFGAIDDLLAKTRVNPRDIGILVVNISLFNPTPSLSSMIVNRYKLRGDIVSCNLGGMGCSAGLISIDLAKRLLQVQPNTYALVMSFESVTPFYYAGNDKAKLLPNCLFRLGGAAILLSNRVSDRRRSKYQLSHTLRTHKGADDRAYKCVFQEEDEEGKIGVTLSKDLMAIAGDALKSNITTLGPLVLPISEQLLFFATLIAKKVLKMDVKPYVPDFKLAFEHFCIHAGGRAVLDELENNLKLTEWHMEPSRMTLYRFGNTSSSSVWYQLAYAEAKGRIRKGDRVWQIAFGSGFKCNSGVWRALRTINPIKEQNPWTNEIDQFPVRVPKVMIL
ncbi:3-ketoacyl-CoA synthase 11-like [Olea europaea var. sylvestris]|uniref:3-ketoacyl-CoA synthase n=1 Tax=Olea europaea subsp. europaea TaxID=158383 RepID=A0A8S0RNF4_OLEEU|nr:3-ketoacyl-CoA synthase 11-like [Olea europaea var. sylvestris]CAA2980703.1 3-ketoacyl- synthase 11-like [Olea europaea subsp. europaea]